MVAEWPTTVTNSRCPRALVRRTQKLYCGPVLRHPAELLPAADLGGRVWLDMLCQFPVRACADWTRATDRVRRRLLERAIDAGARDLPHPRDPHHTVTASQGGRAILAHRLDLLWAKGRLPSSASILALSSSLSMVISPTLDFSRAISSSRSSRSRSFRAVVAPASARSRHSVSLAIETFVSRATSSSGSPRNSRATIAILR